MCSVPSNTNFPGANAAMSVLLILLRDSIVTCALGKIDLSAVRRKASSETAWEGELLLAATHDIATQQAKESDPNLARVGVSLGDNVLRCFHLRFVRRTPNDRIDFFICEGDGPTRTAPDCSPFNANSSISPGMVWMSLSSSRTGVEREQQAAACKCST